MKVGKDIFWRWWTRSAATGLMLVLVLGVALVVNHLLRQRVAQPERFAGEDDLAAWSPPSKDAGNAPATGTVTSKPTPRADSLRQILASTFLEARLAREEAARKAKEVAEAQAAAKEAAAKAARDAEKAAAAAKAVKVVPATPTPAPAAPAVAKPAATPAPVPVAPTPPAPTAVVVVASTPAPPPAVATTPAATPAPVPVTPPPPLLPDAPKVQVVYRGFMRNPDGQIFAVMDVPLLKAAVAVRQGAPLVSWIMVDALDAQEMRLQTTAGEVVKAPRGAVVEIQQKTGKK